MPEPACRLAEESDLAAVANLYEAVDSAYRSNAYQFPAVEHVGQAWLESFRRTLGRFSVLYLAELDGQLVGFTLGRIKRTPPHRGGVLVGEISDVWVEPQARRLGVAARLTRMAVEWLIEQNVHSVEAQILDGNEPSWHLFDKLGFHSELRQVRLLNEKSNA
jgi:ribosomal protein S18 acetylase RimI-like enzyme